MDDDPDDHTVPFDDDGDSVEDQLSLNTNEDDFVEGSDNSSIDEGILSYQSDDEEASDEEDEESDEEDEDDEDEDLSEEEFDEAIYMRKLEDEAFDQELRRLTIEAIEKGKNTARTSASTKVSDTMPSASQFSRKKSSGLVEDVTQGGSFALGGSSGVAFKMLKRGHKGRVEEMSLVVPSETNLAKNASKQDDEVAKERDMLKERVLQYEAESAEQMYSDVYLNQARLPEVRNRPLLMEDIDRNFGSGNYRGRSHSSSGRGGRNYFHSRREQNGP